MNGTAADSRPRSRSAPQDALPAVLVSALLALAPSALAAPSGVEDALQARELICEFHLGYTRVQLADLRRGRPPSELMLVYERIDPRASSAQVVSTRAPGRKPVSARSTPRGVHLIENVNASVMVTTLTACEGWKVKGGVSTCVRFAARHAWHFDLLVHADPDASFDRQPRGAYTGHCEPWHLD